MGGQGQVKGDFVYQDRRLPYTQAGMWGLLRSLDRNLCTNVLALPGFPCAVTAGGGIPGTTPPGAPGVPAQQGFAAPTPLTAPAVDPNAPANLASWSAPKVVSPAGPVGHYDPSIVAAKPGELALAYYTGVPRAPGKDPAWYVRLALVHGATGAPRVEETQVSPIPAYAQSANAMGGSCSSGPEPGLENGFACDRASDDWALGIDSACRLTVVFPTVKNDAPGSDAGTFASTQRSGDTPCGTASAVLLGPRRKKRARRSM